MGLLDQVIGAVGGASGQRSGADGNSLVAGIMQLLDSPQVGGISGLVQSFQNGGLSDTVNSWVSTGRKMPVSSAQIHSVLGSDQVDRFANTLGISASQASDRIAEFLPQVVDHLTPNGEIPENGTLMAQGFDLLKGKLFG